MDSRMWGSTADGRTQAGNRAAAPLRQPGGRGAAESAAHFGLPRPRRSPEDPRVGREFDAVQRAEDSARGATGRADLFGHRPPDDHRRAGYYAPAQAAEGAQADSPAARLSRPARGPDADQRGWAQAAQRDGSGDSCGSRGVAERAEPNGAGGADSPAGTGPRQLRGAELV